ncbi:MULTISPECIES: translation initiation factor IF-3 [Brevibacillus]|uniref:translation initiation factor IF-3 n=1 Tax=Brevibacillus TaxID=55080 RepID=UPI00203F584E|nr:MULTISPECIES: translation initiation factor IF-3 [Brevibacillus]MCM3081387.1 translation initiation factor IF-3 [Brevibacillus invocatus]MCM3431763.1 translation initiation factor IF-3 [Brevibacillus invocatus]MDH4618606.1 translation initiation factor IF-3 [Brevibacillus sp. AY1]
MIKNEKIKAFEVLLTGVHGEDLGIVETKEALRLAKELGVDLVCLSLSTSPPPCQLVSHTVLKEQSIKDKAMTKKLEKGAKVKEIRLSAYIEEHDYDTKKRQAERILSAGDAVQFIVKLEKRESQEAKQLIEVLVRDLKHCGKQDKGIQVSGKQVIAVMKPLD